MLSNRSLSGAASCRSYTPCSAENRTGTSAPRAQVYHEMHDTSAKRSAFWTPSDGTTASTGLLRLDIEGTVAARREYTLPCVPRKSSRARPATRTEQPLFRPLIPHTYIHSTYTLKTPASRLASPSPSGSDGLHRASRRRVRDLSRVDPPQLDQDLQANTVSTRYDFTTTTTCLLQPA
jgi:hypothetical protein